MLTDTDAGPQESTGESCGPTASMKAHESQIAPVGNCGGSLALVAEVANAATYAQAEKAKATRDAYRRDFALFRDWCLTRAVEALPALPESIAAYLASEADRKLRAATIGRRLAAIRYA